MKVVLFCGGEGIKLHQLDEKMPKPMVPIGNRPLIWHVMKYYAHFGHKDFILCLGYRGDMIKQYFLNYEEALSNDFVLTNGGRKRELVNSDIEDWRITFVETGLNANIGERLMAVQPYLEGEETFLANYSDGLTNLHLPTMIEHHKAHGKIATFLAVHPNLSYHFITAEEDGTVTDIQGIVQCGLRVNGGYFIFNKEIFDYMQEGEELVMEPFRRLIARRELVAYNFDGFWMPMDTAKDKATVDQLYASGNPPWQVWKHSAKQRLTMANRQVELYPPSQPAEIAVNS